MAHVFAGFASRIVGGVACLLACAGLFISEAVAIDAAALEQARDYYQAAIDLLRLDVNRAYNADFISAYEAQIESINSILDYMRTPEAE